jgi:hypothetical protein
LITHHILQQTRILIRAFVALIYYYPILTAEAQRRKEK